MKLIFTCLLACLLTWPVWAAGTVNINTASAEQIAEGLNGIGQSKAEEIVRYRAEHGAFTHIDELVNVKGIGVRTVDKNRDAIVLQDAQAQAQAQD
ncbi:MAG TPA: ComEA family DNA-binding protein [Xanthomonadales bacterium]|nr:ComEA family DNA-binding protein [Xanthomonadales bacterium]